MLTLWHSLCAESRDVRKHMQLYHSRGQTLVVRGGEAIIPQGKHKMFVLKGGENIPLFDPMEEPSQASSVIVIIVLLCVDNA